MSRGALLRLLKAKTPSSLHPFLRTLRRQFQPTLPERVASQKSVRRHFHEPIRNNFVGIFFPLSVTPAARLVAIHAAAEPLNEADGALLSFCEELIQHRPELGGLGAIAPLVQWKAHRSSRSFLEGLPSVVALFAHFSERLGEPYSTYLEREAPALLDAFCRMPRSLERVHRLNLFVPPTDVPRLAQQLCLAAIEDRELLAFVTRMEIALTTPRNKNVPTFPTVIFYFDEEAIRAGAEEPLMRWLAAMLPIGPLRTEVPSTKRNERVSSEYAEMWHPLATRTEGFRLYKKYLEALGRLDTVYDKERHHAFAKDSTIPTRSAAPPTVLQDFKRSD